MATEKTENPGGTCFVVMGFGKKTDFESGRVLDLDKSYKYMIKPAVEAAGFKCIRADEIVHSGLIDVPMYEQLLNADVVVADLSTSNKNAFYELGVRHALRPYTTVVIAEDGIKTFPFDVSHVAVRQYHHLGEDIGFEEVMRFRELLTKAIVEISQKSPRANDSPVYTFLAGLKPPSPADDLPKTRGTKSSRSIADMMDKMVDEANVQPDRKSHSALMLEVEKAQKKGDWLAVKKLLTIVREMAVEENKRKQKSALVEMTMPPEDPSLLQQLALATYKSKSPGEKEALLEAHQILNLLNPGTSNDTETLGMWGAVHKRLWELTEASDYLDEAIRAYERGFYIRNDYYNGINYAYLLNVRASRGSEPADAIADFISARRARTEVQSICEQWLKNNPVPPKDSMPEEAINAYFKNWYWVKASLAEAIIGTGDEKNGGEILNEAYDKAPEEWMKTSTEEQLAKLRKLLEKSPLKNISG